MDALRQPRNCRSRPANLCPRSARRSCWSATRCSCARSVGETFAAGHVHAADTPEQAHEALLGRWLEARGQWEAHPHELIERLVVLAATNADADALDVGARGLLREHGLLGGGRLHRLADGGVLDLAVGDQVRVRRNDYRCRRGYGEPDVLNGFRGVVRALNSDGGALVEWRRTTPDGPRLQRARITAEQIAEGALSHGYAMTIAAAQGLTADLALGRVFGRDQVMVLVRSLIQIIAPRRWRPAR